MPNRSTRTRTDREPDWEIIAEIGDRLRRARERVRLSDLDVAPRYPDKPGAPDIKAIRGWERGETNFSVADFRALCIIYRCSADWLLGLEGASMVRKTENGIVVDAEELRVLREEVQEVLRRLDTIRQRGEKNPPPNKPKVLAEP